MAEGYNPYFIDSGGSEVHIGDLVSWVETRGNCGNRLKSGRVLDIADISKDGGCETGDVKCMVHVKGKSQNGRAETFTRLESDTLVGKLTRLVAACGGSIDSAAIEATALEIEDMLAPDDDPEPDGEG